MQNRKDGRRRRKNRRDKINPNGNRAGGKRTLDGASSTSSSQETASARFPELQEQVRSNAQQEVELKNRMESALAQFVSTEIDLALTFCQMASASRDSNSARRRIDRAVEAHESAAHYLQQLDVSDEMRRGISEKLAKLKESLDKVHREKVDDDDPRRTPRRISRC